MSSKNFHVLLTSRQKNYIQYKTLHNSIREKNAYPSPADFESTEKSNREVFLILQNIKQNYIPQL